MPSRADRRADEIGRRAGGVIDRAKTIDPQDTEDCMSDDINVHKVSDKHVRRAEHIEQKLEKKGMGRDQAEKEATRQAVAEMGESTGGKNSGGDAPKHSHNENDHRPGSDKQTHSG